MAKLSYDLYLDESGNFESDVYQHATVSMVGGLLIPSHRASDQMIKELVKERIHAKEHYEHESYFGILRTLIREQGKFVIFNNEERISVINGDFTYLNIISEGIVQLIRNLKFAYPDDEVNLHILIAGRQAIAYKRDEQIPSEERIRIPQEEYFARIEEKLIIAIGRSNIKGITWDVAFGTGDVDKRLMLADLICFTWRFRKGSEFSEEEKDEIAGMIDQRYVYSVFENAVVGSLKRLMMEERYEEVLYQLCNLRKVAAAQPVLQELLLRVKKMPPMEVEALFNYMSLQIGRLNDTYQFLAGIALAEIFKDRILAALDGNPATLEELTAFARFDTDFYLLTMYDHIGNTAKCAFYLNLCKENLSVVRRSSWEHIDYYFRFRIRELNVLMGRFAFEEILRRTDDLKDVLTEARDLFSMIRTYDGVEQSLKSELLGKVYGVRTEALINLLHRRPELLQDALDASEKGLAEFSRRGDISRQEQWRCLLMVEAEQEDEAILWLLRAVGIGSSDNAFAEAVKTIYDNLKNSRGFLLWHYTNVMLLLQKKKDHRAEEMKQVLDQEVRFKHDMQNEDNAKYPWNVVLWNLARYERNKLNMNAYDRMYRRALSITRANPANTTMMTFALSMSADRLLWCRQHKTKDAENAKTEFLSICKESQKIGMTKEMISHFGMDHVLSATEWPDEGLRLIAESYLR